MSTTQDNTTHNVAASNVNLLIDASVNCSARRIARKMATDPKAGAADFSQALSGMSDPRTRAEFMAIVQKEMGQS